MKQHKKHLIVARGINRSRALISFKEWPKVGKNWKFVEKTPYNTDIIRTIPRITGVAFDSVEGILVVYSNRKTYEYQVVTKCAEPVDSMQGDIIA